MLAFATSLADVLAHDGVQACILSMHTISPLDTEAIRLAAIETRLIITLEEHSVVGGLGSAVAETLAEMQRPRARLERVGLKPSFAHVVGDQTYLRRFAGLDFEGVRERVMGLLEENYGLVG
jgi:transketolase